MAAINRAKSIPNKDRVQETGKGLSATLPHQVHLKNPMHTIDVLLLVSSFIHFLEGQSSANRSNQTMQDLSPPTN